MGHRWSHLNYTLQISYDSEINFTLEARAQKFRILPLDWSQSDKSAHLCKLWVMSAPTYVNASCLIAETQKTLKALKYVIKSVVKCSFDLSLCSKDLIFHHKNCLFLCLIWKHFLNLLFANVSHSKHCGFLIAFTYYQRSPLSTCSNRKIEIFSPEVSRGISW